MALNKIKSHKFDGKKYKIKWRKPYKCEGLCDAPSATPENRYIWINPKLAEKELILTLLHEAAHACVWVLDEETVTRTAEDIGDFLWKCGFRLHHTDNG